MRGGPVFIAESLHVLRPASQAETKHYLTTLLDHDRDLLGRIVVAANLEDDRLRARADALRYDDVDLQHPRNFVGRGCGVLDLSRLATDGQRHAGYGSSNAS